MGLASDTGCASGVVHAHKAIPQHGQHTHHKNDVGQHNSMGHLRIAGCTLRNTATMLSLEGATIRPTPSLGAL